MKDKKKINLKEENKNLENKDIKNKKEERIFILIVFSLLVVISFSIFILPLLENVIINSIDTNTVQAVTSIAVLALILGLIDGFNPCAMWVLIYLISLVSELKSRKKMWFVVGTFLGATGVMYFIILYLYLFGWNLISYLGYVEMVLIGASVFAIGSGSYFIYDYIKSKGKVECKVGDFAQRKKTMEKVRKIVHSPLTITSFLAIVLLAFSVNLIEFICSIGIPQAFTGILGAQNGTDIFNFIMISIYIFTFLADDLLIFYLALKAIDSPIFEKYSSFSKIIGGILMLVVGFVLMYQIVFGIDFTKTFLYILLILLSIFLIKLICDYFNYKIKF